MVAYDAMLEMEKLFEQALLLDPQNINLLLRLAILEQKFLWLITIKV